MSSPELPALWTPSKFDGSDLLPVLRPPDPDAEAVVGRDNVSQKDLVLPSIRLLQGMSPEVLKNEVEGARAGLILHTGTQSLLKSPLRVLFVHHSKSNLLAPDATKPEYNGLERCLSRDAITGDRYGDCEVCRKCLDWGPKTAQNPKGTKPLGAQSHNFVCMTELGPAIMRFSRTSFQAARTFITTWMTGSKNLWAHPVVVRVRQEENTLPNGQKAIYYHWEPIWQQAEQVPKAMREMALALHNIAEAAFQAGRMQTTGEDENEPAS
jgi:hypothetical protein